MHKHASDKKSSFLQLIVEWKARYGASHLSVVCGSLRDAVEKSTQVFQQLQHLQMDYKVVSMSTKVGNAWEQKQEKEKIKGGKENRRDREDLPEEHQ